MRPSSSGVRLIVAVAAATAACAVTLPSLAQAQEPLISAPAEISISPCHVKQERNKQYTYAWCTVTSDSAAKVNTSVTVRSNMKPFKPPTNGTWSNQTSTLRFKGGGTQIWGVMYAFKGKTPAQVRKSLKVTLSNAKNATIGTASATVGSR